MRSTVRAGFISLVAALVLGLAPRASEADLLLGLDIDGGFPVGDSSDITNPGFGVGMRLGWHFEDLGSIMLRAEVAFTYNNFSLPDTDDGFTDLLRAIGGVRLGYADQWVPYAYAHLGYGNFAVQFSREEFRDAVGGLTWDAGIAWEPLGEENWRLGLHVAYVSSRFTADSRFEFVAVGIHGDMLF